MRLLLAARLAISSQSNRLPINTLQQFASPREPFRLFPVCIAQDAEDKAGEPS